MGSAGLQFDVADSATSVRLNQKTVFIGTGAQINALTTYAGMVVYCTSTGNGFVTDCLYERDAGNANWHSVPREGLITMWGGAYNAIPAGYLICDGSAVSRTTYSLLFAVIGTTYGAGDGSTTFNVPDFRARFPRGAPASTSGGGTGGEDTHTLSVAELPAHHHSYTATTVLASATGSASAGNGTAANTGDTGSGSAHENRPAYLQVVFIIKI